MLEVLKKPIEAKLKIRFRGEGIMEFLIKEVIMLLHGL